MFVCPQCSYEEMVTGGKDMEFYIEVETNVCKDCQRLADVVIKILDDNYITNDIELDKCP